MIWNLSCTATPRTNRLVLLTGSLSDPPYRVTRWSTLQGHSVIHLTGSLSDSPYMVTQWSTLQGQPVIHLTRSLSDPPYRVTQWSTLHGHSVIHLTRSTGDPSYKVTQWSTLQSYPVINLTGSLNNLKCVHLSLSGTFYYSVCVFFASVNQLSRNTKDWMTIVWFWPLFWYCTRYGIALFWDSENQEHF